MHSYRTMASMPLAIVLTAATFLFMYQLVVVDRMPTAEKDDPPGIHFERIKIPPEPEPEIRKPPPKPEPLSKPPDAPRPDVVEPQIDVEQGLSFPFPDLGNDFLLGVGPGIRHDATQVEGDIAPLVITQPIYPIDAKRRGLEGWVLVEFTINALGMVEDARVVDANPRRVFDRAAIDAIVRWKFKPRVVDGVAVERRATQEFVFKFESE